MSLECCGKCGREFLTEADPYMVTPTKNYELTCFRCFDADGKTEGFILRLNADSLYGELSTSEIDTLLLLQDRIKEIRKNQKDANV